MRQGGPAPTSRLEDGLRLPCGGLQADETSLSGVVRTQRSELWRWIARFASAGGTAYLVLSLVPLGFLLASGRGWPTERSAVISISRGDGREYDGFGLTYEGLGGGILLWGELLLVIAALILTWRERRLARIAHLGLVLWALLLAANFWWVITASGYGAIAWMLPIVTLGAGMVLVRWRQSFAARASDGRRALPL